MPISCSVPRLLVALVAALATSLLGLAPAQALPVGDHQDPRMIDIDTPVYVGYSSKLKAYHLYVTGRWRPACGSSKYCWAAMYPGQDGNIGSKDGVRMRFSDSVAFKKFRIRAYDACGDLKYQKATTLDSGSFDNAYAGLADRTFISWASSSNGSSGTCKSSMLPTSSLTWNGVTNHYWSDLAARSFRYDVWVNPLPSQGRCYDRLYVHGGYTHTWSSSGLAWSAGVGFPWGFSVGVGGVSGSADFTVWENGDGYPADTMLTTPKLCHH